MKPSVLAIYLVFTTAVLGIAVPMRHHYGHQVRPDRPRTAQIQRALVNAGYLKRVSGVWDAETVAALKQLQADHRWQTKRIPDARALIYLGLGPSYKDRIN